MTLSLRWSLPLPILCPPCRPPLRQVKPLPQRFRWLQLRPALFQSHLQPGESWLSREATPSRSTLTGLQLRASGTGIHRVTDNYISLISHPLVGAASSRDGSRPAVLPNFVLGQLARFGVQEHPQTTMRTGQKCAEGRRISPAHSLCPNLR